MGGEELARVTRLLDGNDSLWPPGRWASPLSRPYSKRGGGGAGSPARRGCGRPEAPWPGRRHRVDLQPPGRSARPDGAEPLHPRVRWASPCAPCPWRGINSTASGRRRCKFLATFPCYGQYVTRRQHAAHGWQSKRDGPSARDHDHRRFICERERAVLVAVNGGDYRFHLRGNKALVWSAPCLRSQTPHIPIRPREKRCRRVLIEGPGVECVSDRDRADRAACRSSTHREVAKNVAHTGNQAPQGR